MAPIGPFSDPKDIKWTWNGEGTQSEDKQKVFYESAEVVRISDGSRRTFKLGDAVSVAGEQGQAPWIAHIVELFDLDADGEVQIVGDTNEWNSMRCTLRWLYNHRDMDKKSLRLCPKLPPSVRGEVYFSDHIERSGSNDLEVIEGRAFLFSSLHELRSVVDSLKDNPPAEYWEGDAIRLVRFFYGYNSGNPAPIRELEGGELKFLLDNPSTDMHLYRKARSILYGVTGGVRKGITKRQHSGSSSKQGRVSDGTLRRGTRNSPGSSKDHADSTTESTAHPSRTASSAPGRVTETIVKSGWVHRAKPSSAGEKLEKTGSSEKVQESLSMEVDTGSSAIESEEMKAAFHKLNDTMKTVPLDQQLHVFANMRNMVNAMFSTMADKNLSFGMGKDDQNNVAKVVAKQIFGSSEAVGSSSGTASDRESPSLPPVTPKSRE